MKLFQQIKDDQLVARKTKQKVKISLLTTLLGELETDMKGKGLTEVSDELVVAKVKKFIKGLEEVVRVSELGSDAQATALIEDQILQPYLPKQLTEGELTDIIKASGTDNMGKAMGYLKQNYAGLYDGKLASTIAKGLF